MGKKKYRQKNAAQNQQTNNQASTLRKDTSVVSLIKNQQNSDSDLQQQDFLQQIYSIKVQFSYKQWILLGISKLVPHKDKKNINIDLKSKKISGNKQKVDQFVKKCQNQLKIMKMKILKLKVNIPIQQMQIQMDQQFKCKACTVVTLKQVCNKIIQHYNAKQQILEQLSTIVDRDQINTFTRFIWIKEQYYQQACKKIKTLNKKYSSSDKSQQTILSQSLIQTSPIKSKKQQQKPVLKQFRDQSQSSQPDQQSYFSLTNKHMKKQYKTQPKKPQKKEKQLKQFIHLLDEDLQISRIQPDTQRYVDEKKARRRQPRQGQQQSSFSTRQTKNENQRTSRTQVFGPPQRGNRPQAQTKVIFSQQYPIQYIDREHLKKWTKNNQSIKDKNMTIKQKFNQQQSKMLLQIVITDEKINPNVQYAINMYFRHQKVIILQQDEQLRDKIIAHFKRDDPWLSIDYRRIYTNQKFPKQGKLRDLAKKNNTAQHMYKSAQNQHHVLYVVGLLTQMGQIQAKINQFIQQQENITRKKEFDIKFQEVQEFSRNKEVQIFLQDCTKQFMLTQTQKFRLIQLKFLYSTLKLEVQLFNIHKNDVQRTIEKFQDEINRQISIFEFTKSEYTDSKRVFQQLSYKYLLKSNKKQGMTLISTRIKINQQISEINNEIIKNKKSTTKQLLVNQKSQLGLIKTFIQKKRKQDQFSSSSIQDIRYEQADVNFKIILYGQLIVIDSLIQQIQGYIADLTDKISEYYQNFTEEQLQIIEKDKQFIKNVENQYKLAIKLKKNVQIGAVIKIQSKIDQKINKKFISKIIFEKQFNFLSIVQNSFFVFRSRKQIQQKKQTFLIPLKTKLKKSSTQFQSHYDKIKKCTFLFEQNGSPLKILSSIDTQKVYMYLPDDDGSKFITQLIEAIDLLKVSISTRKQFEVIIIGKNNTDFKNIIKLEQGKTYQKQQKIKKWYTGQQNEKFYYSDKGNQKINQAYEKNQPEVQLNNQDLNLKVKTHQLDFQTNQMTHAQSGKVWKLNVNAQNITFQLNGVIKAIPDSQYKKVVKKSGFMGLSIKLQNCQLSIGFYKINFAQNRQINLFSNYSRKLKFDEQIVTKPSNYDLDVTYDQKVFRIIFQYAQQNQKFVKSAVQYVDKYLQKKCFQKQIDLKSVQISKELILDFFEEACDENIKIQFTNNDKNVIFSAFNQKKVQNFIKRLINIVKIKKQSKIQCEYPKYWQPQVNQIETFVVQNNSVQFMNIQKVFNIALIQKLIRIQNKIVYRRFHQQKLFLKVLNNGKQVKQMKLYHGTRLTDPKIIYEDKEQCFNINYTSDKNLLGKGIYFAQRPEYSIGYSHTDQFTKIRSMFYCDVLVGQSQKCLKHSHDIKDTSYRDTVNRIKYQSMTDYLVNSNVFVVYKSKRAYPSYLIQFK